MGDETPKDMAERWLSWTKSFSLDQNELTTQFEPNILYTAASDPIFTQKFITYVAKKYDKSRKTDNYDDHSMKFMNILAAGALETLLVYHGHQVVSYLEKCAIISNSLRYMLSRVWYARVNKNVADRLGNLRLP